MKDSCWILEDSEPAAVCLFKVVHNQWFTVTDLVVKRGRAQKNHSGVWDGSDRSKGRSLFVAPVLCFAFIVVSRFCAPPGHCLVQCLNSPFFPPHIGTEPGRAKEESRITYMRMLRTPPFFSPYRGKTIFGSTFQIRLVAQFSDW